MPLKMSKSISFFLLLGSCSILALPHSDEEDLDLLKSAVSYTKHFAQERDDLYPGIVVLAGSSLALSGERDDNDFVAKTFKRIAPHGFKWQLPSNYSFSALIRKDESERQINNKSEIATFMDELYRAHALAKKIYHEQVTINQCTENPLFIMHRISEPCGIKTTVIAEKSRELLDPFSFEEMFRQSDSHEDSRNTVIINTSMKSSH